MNNRLIPMDENAAIRPIDNGKILRCLINKYVIKVIKCDVKIAVVTVVITQ